jgi:hypothetical protein
MRWGCSAVYAVARVNYDRFVALEKDNEDLRRAKITQGAIDRLVEMRGAGVRLRFQPVQYQIEYEKWLTDVEQWLQAVSDHLATPGFPPGSRHEFGYPDIPPAVPGSENYGFTPGHASNIRMLSRRLEILTKIIDRSTV